MTGLRIEVDLDAIGSNARELLSRCADVGMSVTGVTKAMLGAPELAEALNDLCVLGDSRIVNIERMRRAGIATPMLLLRSPAPSEIDRVVDADVMSANTEVEVLTALSVSALAAGRCHDVMLMVELGDLREGIMPDRLHEVARHVLELAGLELGGLGANLACRSGVEPSSSNMTLLSGLADSLEETFGVAIPIVSGGNSANLDWAFATGDTARVNNLRLGESILLGCNPLDRQPIPGLRTDAVSLVVEVIESQRKPTLPWGQTGENAFGETEQFCDRGEVWQTIYSIGRQDTDPGDLTGPPGVAVIASSSDHLVAETSRQMRPGDETRFAPGYSALLRSMTSPTVAKVFTPTRA